MEGVIQELQELRSSPCQLVSKEGTICDIPMRFLHRCPVLDKHPDWKKMLLKVSYMSILIFRDYLTGVKRSRIDDVFEIMAFACKIECEDFQAYCARAANGIAVPDEVSADTIISVVGALVRFLPVRTSAQYNNLVNKCCRKDDQLRNRLLESVETILHERETVAYAPLNIPFFEVEATVALMKNIYGRNITAILHNNKWLPVNLFGSKFCPFEAQVKQFHLSLGRYVVYETSSGSVLTKDLQSDTPAKVIFETSKFFSSRCSKLHVISKNATTNREELFEWNDQKRKFIKKFSHPKWVPKNVNRDFNGHLIVELQEGFAIDLNTEERIAKEPEGGYKTDYFKRLYCSVDNSYYKFILPGVKEPDTYYPFWISDSLNVKSVHFGFNLVGTYCVYEGTYETIVVSRKQYRTTKRDEEILCKGLKSNFHGEVIAFSDLLLV